jgi:hypothetical protein
MRILKIVLAAAGISLLAVGASGQQRGSAGPRGYPRPGGGYRGGTVYVPVPVPVGPGYIGGYGYGYYGAPPAGYDPSYGPYDPSLAYSGAPTPTVIINQNFQPDTVNPVLRDYSNLSDQPSNVTQLGPQPPAPPVQPHNVHALDSPALRDDQPTIFLIAMKDHTIYPVIAYWVDKDTLKYVTVESVIKSVPLDQVDRDMSKQLNDQRNVDFKLPAR